jgi:hypothetical protein
MEEHSDKSAGRGRQPLGDFVLVGRNFLIGSTKRFRFCKKIKIIINRLIRKNPAIQILRYKHFLFDESAISGQSHKNNSEGKLFKIKYCSSIKLEVFCWKEKSKFVYLSATYFDDSCKSSSNILRKEKETTVIIKVRKLIKIVKLEMKKYLIKLDSFYSNFL